jgi:hypothetical protein
MPTEIYHAISSLGHMLSLIDGLDLESSQNVIKFLPEN